MAKTRAQRKAERRRRQQEAGRQPGTDGGAAERARDQRPPQDPPSGVSGEVAEAEAVIQTGARTEDYGEHTVERDQQTATEEASSPVPGVVPAPVRPEPPAPSRADAPPEAKKSRRQRRAERKAEEERDRKQRESEARLRREEPTEERRRGVVTGFFASCWAELKRVQWPDRETLVQASAVTLVFVAVLAAYLGALDAIFNFLIKRII